jgi:hypothetical protein
MVARKLHETTGPRGAMCVGASALHALAVASSNAAAVFYLGKEPAGGPSRRMVGLELKAKTKA